MARALRDLTLIAVLGIAAFGYDRRGRADARDGDARGRRTEHVILVVADGLRWQEVFRGADASLLRGAGAGARERYWRADAGARRQALMPFLWSTVAREGQLLGNRDLGSAVRVTNPYRFSYPGYNELLTGIPDRRIDRNDFGPNPNVTVFEWLARQPGFGGRVAVVGAWEAFADIFNRSRSQLPMHAARDEPLDRNAHAAAMRFLRTRQPRALFVAYVETDDRAHSGDYARTLDAAHAVDRYLAELWATVQANPRTRGRTTLIFMADHGRGRGGQWTTHGATVPGADEIFLAILGPDTPARGEVQGGATIAQARTAATVAAVLGQDFRAAIPAAAPPLLALVAR